MIEEIEADYRLVPRLSLAEVVDAVATWALLGAVVAICWLGDTLSRRQQDRR